MAATAPFLHLDELKPWNDRTNRLRCVARLSETSDVMTFVFEAVDAAWFRYLPGQFVTLELPVGPEPVMRTYTLSSSPSRPMTVAVTVKAQASSIGTRWMFEQLMPGMELKAHGPLGDFTFLRHPGEKYLFISAGSGVTPMMSMTRFMADRAPDSDVAFLTCARSPRDILFAGELSLISALMPRLRIGYVVETAAPQDGWHGLTGRIDATRLSLLVPDFRERTVFCCGPEPFMRGVRGILADAGFDMGQYHEESFQPAAAAAPLLVAEIAAAAPVAAATVTFSLAGKQGKCPPGQTILQTARLSGVRIGAACEGGLCGTCRVLKLSGEVDMAHNGGILDDEIEEGYILACCSRPIGDVSIEA